MTLPPEVAALVEECEKAIDRVMLCAADCIDGQPEAGVNAVTNAHDVIAFLRPALSAARRALSLLASPPAPCEKCSGKGQVPVVGTLYPDGSVDVPRWTMCATCDGSGCAPPSQPPPAPVEDDPAHLRRVIARLTTAAEALAEEAAKPRPMSREESAALSSLLSAVIEARELCAR